tara:strand:+ start:394 stop:1677 length:1284 start_codon:yes stop_codon:yes gene_type:complete
MRSKPLTLHKDNYFDSQWKFLRNPKNARISCFTGGMGSGKTTVLTHKIFKCLLEKVNPQTGKSNGLILYPTFSLAEEVFVEPFIDILERNGIAYTYNIAAHKFRTVYGDLKIYITNQPHKIVGSNYTYCGIDELDIETYKNAEMSVQKALSRLRGCDNAELFITSTPEGFHFLYDFMVINNNDNKFLVHGKTTDNKYLPESYIQSLKDNYDENLLKAYLLGQFVNLQKGATYDFDREIHIKECKYNKHKPLYIGLDFNILPMAACIIQEQQNSPQIQVIDEILLSHQGGGDLMTRRMCETIRQKYPNNIYHMFPDATGKARGSSSRYSDIEIIRREHGFNVHVRHANPLVINRVNSVNNNLSKKNIIIDPSCKMLIRDFEQVVNKEGTREIDKSGMKSDLSHISDAFGYYCNFRHPSIRPKIGVKPR